MCAMPCWYVQLFPCTIMTGDTPLAFSGSCADRPVLAPFLHGTGSGTADGAAGFCAGRLQAAAGALRCAAVSRQHRAAVLCVPGGERARAKGARSSCRKGLCWQFGAGPVQYSCPQKPVQVLWCCLVHFCSTLQCIVVWAFTLLLCVCGNMTCMLAAAMSCRCEISLWTGCVSGRWQCTR